MLELWLQATAKSGNGAHAIEELGNLSQSEWSVVNETT